MTQCGLQPHDEERSARDWVERLRYCRFDCQLCDTARCLLLGARRAMPHHSKSICERVSECFLRCLFVGFLRLFLHASSLFFWGFGI